MGSSSTKLAVSTDKANYSAGDCITGTIYLNVSSKGAKSNSLQLCLTGEEISVVHYTTTETRNDSDGTSRSSERHHEASTKRNLFNVEFAVAAFPGGRLEPGQYEFPFRAHLPPGLPSTMYCAYSRSRCEIEYKIRAYLQGGWHGDSTRIIYVSSVPRSNEELLAGPLVCPPDTQRVNFCCCVNRGSMTIQADADRGIVARGESLRVGFACENNSTVDMLGVNVELKEELNWQAHGHHERFSRTIAKQQIPPGHITERAISGYQPLQNVFLTISPDVRDTYEGSLIQVKHRLTVTLNTKCCISNPEVIMLIRVQPPISVEAELVDPTIPMPPPTNPEAQIDLTIPPDWSPQKASTVEIPTESFVYGGASAPPTNSSQEYDSSYIPPVSANPGSFQEIEQRMDRAFDHWGLTDKLSQDPTYIPTLQNLTPNEYASLIAKIKSIFDQPRCAKRLAEVMGELFTCAHVAAACRYVPDMYRTNVVLKIAPLASDLDWNKHLIAETLTGFEKLQCKDVLE